MTVTDTLTMKYFPVVVQGECTVLNRIHPLKQALVLRICEVARELPVIQCIYIFGSSTTGLCHIDSDIDLCVKYNTQDEALLYSAHAKIGSVCDWKCDILSYENLGDKLRTVIEREGVLIYEQAIS